MLRDKRLILICLMASIVMQVGIAEVSAAAPGTRVRIEPADLVVGLNEIFVIQVVIEEASNLGGFEFNLIYDPSVLQVTEAALGDFLESTGNSAVTTGPEVDNAEGRATFWAVGLGEEPGPSGTGVLATITCVAQGEGSTVVGLQEVQVLDTAASAQRVTVEDGQVVVRSAEAPTPTVTATPMPAATATPAPAATATPAPAATPTTVPSPTAPPAPAATASPAPAATATPMPTNTPEAVDTPTPVATTLPSPTPGVTGPAAETPTESPLPSPTPSPMPSVSIAATEMRLTEVTTPLAVPTTVEVIQAPAAVATAPIVPSATSPPPSPSATPMPSPTLIPSPTPLSTIPVPAATESSSGVVLGLMLAALAAATLAVSILSRRPAS